MLYTKDIEKLLGISDLDSEYIFKDIKYEFSQMNQFTERFHKKISQMSTKKSAKKKFFDSKRRLITINAIIRSVSNVSKMLFKRTN